MTGADASGAPAPGPLVLELDSPSYTTAEVFELATGRSRRFDLPKAGTPRLSLTTANGPLAVVLTAREKAPSEATRAATDVTAVRGLTVEEILARHQVWRAGRDARWTRFTATNRTSYRFRLEGFPTSFELTFEGPFFYERGKGFDWSWQTAYFNGVRWKGKKAPELPLLQPEKVSELPLDLTFNEAYRYELDGEGEAGGIPCWVVRFEPSEGFRDKAIYAGKVYIGKADFSLRRVVAQAAEPDGRGPVGRRDDRLRRGRGARRRPAAPPAGHDARAVDPPHLLADDDARADDRAPRGPPRPRRLREPARRGPRRQPGHGPRHRQGRAVPREAEGRRARRRRGREDLAPLRPRRRLLRRLVRLPLPLLGLYYIDLDVAKKRKQLQGFFGGPILAGSYNDPNLFGTNLDLGADVFANFVRGDDALWVDGEKVDETTVKARSFAANLNVGYPLSRHLKLTATLGGT